MNASPLRVDWSCALQPTTAGGFAPATWDAALAQACSAASTFRTEHAAGEHAFVNLANGPDDTDAMKAWCAQAPAHDVIIVAGMGGSALSARVFDALRDTPEQPRLVVLDTVDPHTVSRALRHDPQRTLLIGISKSGGTLETGAVFLTLEAWMHAALGADAAAHIALVCGEEDNVLRRRSIARGYTALSIPSDVGGRYSGLTTAGLLPAALGGVDVDAVIAGAAWAWQHAASNDPSENPALALTALHNAARTSGRPTAVLMPYGERLRPLAPWWAQLVGESLGKDGQGIEPIAAAGPADQHSLLQLWLEGPDTRLVFTVGADDHGMEPVQVPADDGFVAGGHALADILDAECDATRAALQQSGRPVVHIGLAAADARSIGAFLMTYELTVVWTAHAMGVSPYGQPAVQLGKTLALERLKARS